MDTNKIREAQALIDEARHRGHNIPQLVEAARLLKAELDVAPKVLTEDSGDMAASLGISEGLQARIDFANRLPEARSSQSRQPSEVLAEPVAWIVVSSIRDIGIPTLAITKEAARQVAIERCYYLSDVQHSEPIPLYLAPAAGLTVERAMEVMARYFFEVRQTNIGHRGSKVYDDLLARLTEAAKH